MVEGQIRYLTQTEIIEINRKIMASFKEGSVGIQYPEGLDLVVEQPQMTVFGRELYPTLWVKAAYIMQKITKKHIFADGNKRTSYLAAWTFLALNGYKLVISTKVAGELMLEITNSPDSEEVMLQVAKILKKNSVKE